MMSLRLLTQSNAFWGKIKLFFFFFPKMAFGCYWVPVEIECLTMGHGVTRRSNSLSHKV